MADGDGRWARTLAGETVDVPCGAPMDESKKAHRLCMKADSESNSSDVAKWAAVDLTDCVQPLGTARLVDSDAPQCERSHGIGATHAGYKGSRPCNDGETGRIYRWCLASGEVNDAGYAVPTWSNFVMHDCAPDPGFVQSLFLEQCCVAPPRVVVNAALTVTEGTDVAAVAAKSSDIVAALAEVHSTGDASGAGKTNHVVISSLALGTDAIILRYVVDVDGVHAPTALKTATEEAVSAALVTALGNELLTKAELTESAFVTAHHENAAQRAPITGAEADSADARHLDAGFLPLFLAVIGGIIGLVALVVAIAFVKQTASSSSHGASAFDSARQRISVGGNGNEDGGNAQASMSYGSAAPVEMQDMENGLCGGGGGNDSYLPPASVPSVAPPVPPPVPPPAPPSASIPGPVPPPRPPSGLFPNADDTAIGSSSDDVYGSTTPLEMP
jgi:hypothetical protein